MAVLKRKQTSTRDNQHIRIVHPYAYFFVVQAYIAVSVKQVVVSHNLTRNASVGMYYTYMLIIPITFFFLPSLLYFSIIFYTCQH